MANVFLGVPLYGAIIPQALPGLIQATKQHRCWLQTEVGSILTMMFNKLWVSALNQRQQNSLTHFVMHHADIEAPPGWLDILVNELATTGADILSVIVAIKDGRGLTSTGYQNKKTGKIRRFTIAEVLDLPPTFDAADSWLHSEEGRRPDQTADDSLVVNTGLWICDFTKPWVEDACFSTLDAIARENDGNFVARCMPEDWNFSRWCANRGLKVYATRKVAIGHYGPHCYRNDKNWGHWDTDLGDTVEKPLAA